MTVVPAASAAAATTIAPTFCSYHTFRRRCRRRLYCHIDPTVVAAACHTSPDIVWHTAVASHSVDIRAAACVS
jgi:hypothetical protein